MAEKEPFPGRRPIPSGQEAPQQTPQGTSRGERQDRGSISSGRPFPAIKHV